MCIRDSANGGGTFSNTNALILNNADSKIRFNGPMTVGAASVTAASNTGKGLNVYTDVTISSLTVSADTEIIIANSKTLSGATEIAEDTTLTLSSTGTGTFASTLNLKGTLQTGAGLEVSGLISVGGDSAISIPSADTTLTYSGDEISLGANTITLTGGGNLVSGGMTLDNANSKLLLSSITVDNVSTSADNSGLDVDDDSTVTSLTVCL